MQENNQGNNSCQVCGAGSNGRCGSCGMSQNYFGNHVLRWILGIIIISWVFSIGMKFGEMKAMYEASSPYGYTSGHMIRVSPMMGANVISAVGQAGFSPAENVTFTTSSAAMPTTASIKSGTIQMIKAN